MQIRFIFLKRNVNIPTKVLDETIIQSKEALINEMLSSDDKDKKGNYYMEIPYDTDITINDETLDITEGGETVSTEVINVIQALTKNIQVLNSLRGSDCAISTRLGITALLNDDFYKIYKNSVIWPTKKRSA